jgi:hypothetical protein
LMARASTPPCRAISAVLCSASRLPGQTVGAPHRRRERTSATSPASLPWARSTTTRAPGSGAARMTDARKAREDFVVAHVGNPAWSPVLLQQHEAPVEVDELALAVGSTAHDGRDVAGKDAVAPWSRRKLPATCRRHRRSNPPCSETLPRRCGVRSSRPRNVTASSGRLWDSGRGV